MADLTADERRAPVNGAPHGTIAWSEHEKAWTAYARSYRGQDAEMIARRGGFGVAELVSLLGYMPTTWKPSTATRFDRGVEHSDPIAAAEVRAREEALAPVRALVAMCPYDAAAAHTCTYFVAVHDLAVDVLGAEPPKPVAPDATDYVRICEHPNAVRFVGKDWHGMRCPDCPAESVAPVGAPVTPPAPWGVRAEDSDAAL